MVTGAAHPDICHVFPFAAKKSPGQTATGLAVYADLWGEQVFSRLEDLLVKEGNIIDTAKNMVALQPLLHRWWSKAIIGFEPIEKMENGIRLRFRWLRKTGLLMKDEVLLHTNPLTRLQPYSDKDGHIGIQHAKTGRPIVDGTVIEIVAQDASAIPNWEIFSLQWDLLRMTTMCGAAEAIDEDDWESEDDDDVQLAKVARTTEFVHQARALTAPEVQLPRSPLQLPLQPRGNSPTKALQPRDSSPTKSLRSRQSSPTKSFQPLESTTLSRGSSPAKSSRGKVDENKPW